MHTRSACAACRRVSPADHAATSPCPGLWPPPPLSLPLSPPPPPPSAPPPPAQFGAKFAANPRINTALTVAIRAFKAGDAPAAGKAFVRINNDDRPDEAFTTDRAVRAGRANAASGRIMVTVPNDHFGPIPPEADPRGLVRRRLCESPAGRAGGRRRGAGAGGCRSWPS